MGGSPPLHRPAAERGREVVQTNASASFILHQASADCSVSLIFFEYIDEMHLNAPSIPPLFSREYRSAILIEKLDNAVFKWSDRACYHSNFGSNPAGKHTLTWRLSLYVGKLLNKTGRRSGAELL